MKKFFLITPYINDNEFSQKKEIVKALSVINGFEFNIAEEVKIDDKLSIELTLTLITESNFCIADLSYERPSCYFEVGYLQALNKKVYLIARDNTIIHQVLNPETIKYYANIDAYKVLVEDIFRQESTF
jgi:nucleoside 2-deoxyribosyltransferase